MGIILIEPWGIERCSGFFTWNTLPWLHEKSLKLLFLTKVNLCFPYSKFNKGHKIIKLVPKFISNKIENFFISKDFKFAEFIKYFADLNSKKPTGGKAMLKLIKFGGFGGHVPYAKNPLFKTLKRETESFPCDIHFVFGKDSWVKRHDAEKIFWMIKDREDIKSSFTIVPDSGHQINVENPARLNPVLQNILNKYN